MPANVQQMRRLTDGLPSKSEKMRVLAKAGYGRKAIADSLDVRYQFVRNVLVQDENREAKKSARGGSNDGIPQPAKLRLGPDGRIVIPAAFREALGLSEGDILIASIDDGELTLLSRRVAVKRASYRASRGSEPRR